jgi:carbonic anhydrase
MIRCLLAVTWGLLGAVVAAASEPVKLPPSAEIVLEWLRYGNERHAQGKYVHWHQSVERRQDVAHNEKPHAVILTCSDSRVPPELLFDQGIGDLYVVRVAGNGAGEREIATIEYAAERLGVPLIVVLGHQRCHIAEAAVKGGEVSRALAPVVASFAPAVARVKSLGGDPTDHAARIHAEFVAEKLRTAEPGLARLVRMGKLRVVSAYYSLDDATVGWAP